MRLCRSTAASPPCRKTLVVKPLPVPPAPITAAPIPGVESPTPIAAAPVSPAATPIPAIISPTPATPVLSLLGRDAVEVLRLDISSLGHAVGGRSWIGGPRKCWFPPGGSETGRGGEPAEQSE